MVDRVYKADIVALRKALEQLRTELSRADFPTNWVTLRVEPLLAHARSLESLLRSQKFAGEFARLRRGVVFFHSDLEYLRLNVKELRKLLASARSSSPRRK